ncbi:hypothetical protein Nepgr_027097 [Nepenthes gracilis]|uniref:Uncharacterized protein n=1 Tax=Nepenthes gracilis TaxID=150966 RepID=A0AAD3T9Q5_NEPGR|nr:hypothetical protein Nepgr_027097 [Nepenthes gracilis]
MFEVGFRYASLAPSMGSAYEKPTTKNLHKLSLSPFASTMVNTRAQASDPARDAANPDQGHAADVLVNGATGEVPPPYIQQLVEQMQDNNRLLQLLCEQKEQQQQTAPPAVIPAPATKKGGQRKKKPANRPRKAGNNLAPASSRVPG